MKVYNLWETISSTAWVAALIGIQVGAILLERHFITTLRHYTDINERGCQGVLELLFYLALCGVNFLAYVSIAQGLRRFRSWSQSIEIELSPKTNLLTVKFRKV